MLRGFRLFVLGADNLNFNSILHICKIYLNVLVCKSNFGIYTKQLPAQGHSVDDSSVFFIGIEPTFFCLQTHLYNPYETTFQFRWDGDNRWNLHHLCIYQTSLLDERWVLPFDQRSHAKHLRHKTSPLPLLSEQHKPQGGFVGNQRTSSFSVKAWQSKSHELSPGDILQHFLNTNKDVLCLIIVFKIAQFICLKLKNELMQYIFGLNLISLHAIY